MLPAPLHRLEPAADWEALTNALKQAQAKTISIELSYELDRVFLTIRDDGRGFTPPTTIDHLNGGFGLVGMYERCDRIGAQLSLSSQIGQGTQILVESTLSLEEDIPDGRTKR